VEEVNMLRVLIIDDEYIIRKGLKTIIDWLSFGFDICGEAENGVEGLQKILKCKPDLVIVDIKMPAMDGLQMISESKRRGDTCSFIILTAYSDIKFAQKSIELGIDSYILKPIEQSDLIEQICRVNAMIKSRYEIKQCIDNSIMLSKGKILEAIVTGHIPDERYQKLYNLDFPWKSYNVGLVDTGFESADNTALKSGISAEIESFISDNNYGHVFDIGKFIGVLFKNLFCISLPRVLVNLQGRLSKTCSITATISLGNSVDTLEKVIQSYRHACMQMDNKFLYGYKGIIYETENEGSDVGPDSYSFNQFNFDSLLEKLYSAVDVNNIVIINDILEEIKSYFIKLRYNDEIIKLNYTSLYLTVLNRLAFASEAFRHYSLQKGEVLKEICSKTNLQELHGYIKYMLLSIAEELNCVSPAGSINKILDYIDRNYRMDIKLENLASLFNYNSAYLGKLFKSHAGQSFNTYLDCFRIEKAKQMLKNGMKVYQVAEKVGIKDIDYFYKKFKKYTGVSPSYFRDTDSSDLSEF